jgi:hypothetical protein
MENEKVIFNEIMNLLYLDRSLSDLIAIICQINLNDAKVKTNGKLMISFLQNILNHLSLIM